MPAEFVKCVDALIKQGKEKNSAYAICTTQYKKRHKGHTPQQDEASLEPTQDEIDALAFMYEEVAKAKTEKEKKHMMKNLDIEKIHRIMQERMKR